MTQLSKTTKPVAVKIVRLHNKRITVLEKNLRDTQKLLERFIILASTIFLARLVSPLIDQEEKPFIAFLFSQVEAIGFIAGVGIYSVEQSKNNSRYEYKDDDD